MPQLKPSFIFNIREYLNTRKFSVEDFDLTFPEKGKTLVQITFLHKPEFKIWLVQETITEEIKVKEGFSSISMSEKTFKNTNEKTTVIMCPGKYKTQEEYELSDPGGLQKYIQEWCENIYSDLVVLVPIIDPLEAIRKKFEEQIQTNIENPELLFSKEELDSVKCKIDEMYNQIEKLNEQLKLNKQQLAQIRNELESYKATAENLPKGVWAKITSNKILRLLGGLVNTPEGRKFIFTTIQNTLGMKPDA